MYSLLKKIGNKFIYGHIGAVDYLLGKRQLLSKNLNLTCDGHKIKLPDIVKIFIFLLYKKIIIILLKGKHHYIKYKLLGRRSI